MPDLSRADDCGEIGRNRRNRLGRGIVVGLRSRRFQISELRRGSRAPWRLASRPQKRAVSSIPYGVACATPVLTETPALRVLSCGLHHHSTSPDARITPEPIPIP